MAQGEDGSIASGLPIVETRWLRTRRWVSLPFTDACAPLGDLSSVDALVRGLEAERRSARVAGSEIRAAIADPTGRLVDHGFTHRLELQADAAAVRRTFDRSQVQRGITRSERDAVHVRRGESPDDLLSVYYGLHLATRRRQGAPIQPRRFFELLWTRLLEPGLGFLLLAEHGGRAVAGAVFLEWNGQLVYKLGASDASALAVRPNHAVLWHAISLGCERGDRVFDFGRTEWDNEGLRRFKAGWGTTETALTYTSFGQAALPGAGRLLPAVIRRSPSWVCRFLGERLYRYAA